MADDPSLDDTAASETAMAVGVTDSQAWADVDDEDRPERAPWRVAWGRSAAVLVGCLMVAVLVVLAWRELPADRSSETARTPVSEATAQPTTPAPTAAPAVAPSPPLPAPSGAMAQKLIPPPPPSPVSAPDPDAIYLQLLSDAGVRAPTTEKAIANGHLICQQLEQGNTVQGVVDLVARVNPSLGPDRSKGTVYAAIDAYCPQYDDRGEY